MSLLWMTKLMKIIYRLKKSVSNQKFFLTLGLVLIFSIVLIGRSYFELKKIEKVQIISVKSIPRNYFINDHLEAKGVVVLDARTDKILFEKNPNTALPLASLTKIMTALVADESLPKDSEVIIDQSSLAVDGESGFKENQKWKFNDLLHLTLLKSSNDGAHAIANAVSSIDNVSFQDKMNEKAKELDLSSMRFNNESGLDLENTNQAGGYGSAMDMAKLMQYILNNKADLLEITKNDLWNFKSLDNTFYQVKNTDLVVDKIPGILASKTGYTLLAGGNLTVAFDVGLNHPIIIVVLGSSWDGRFSDVLTLAESAQKTYSLARD